MRTHPLGPSVELPGCHETCEGCPDMGGSAPCERTHWVPRWNSLEGTKRVRGVPKWAGRRHANAPTEALGGRRHANAPTGALGGAPWGLRNV
eukprot:5494832-Pyramimonas_sp.AAC.1